MVMINYSVKYIRQTDVQEKKIKIVCSSSVDKVKKLQCVQDYIPVVIKTEL